MARYETAQKKQAAGSADLPAQSMQLREGGGEWVDANFVSGWKLGARIKLFIKKQMRPAIDRNPQALLRSLQIGEDVRNSACQRLRFRFSERRHMQAVIYPNATLHS